MNPARFSVKQPVLVNLIALIVIVAGVMVVRSMSREGYPVIETGWVRVDTVFRGADPEEVERLVTTPIEEAVAELDGVERVVSSSSEGRSNIGIELAAGLDDTAPVVSRITAEVQALRDLPPQAEAPVVRVERVRVPTITVGIHGDVPDAVLQATGRHVQRRLLRVHGITEVEVAGLRDRQLRVEVDPDRLRAAGISLGEVAQNVASRADDLAAGRTDDGRRQRIVRGLIQANSAASLGDVIVRPDPEGGAVRLRHVADVSDIYAVEGVAARVEGEPGVLLNLHRAAGADAIRVNEAVRRAVEDERASLPEGVHIALFADSSHAIARTTEMLYSNAAFGLLLVFVVLGFFMGPRNAAVAAFGVPVALTGGLLVMHLFGITLNILSLGTLILCVGLVVDDAIVLIDNIYRHVEEGASRVDAAIDGTREVMWPVISATCTTCAAFLPLLLMTGILGEVFAIIPKVVVAVLVASLIEALFILPSHMADFGGRRPATKGAGNGLFARLVAAAIARYEKLLDVCLRWHKSTIVLAYLAFACLVGAALLTKDIVLLSESDVDVYDVRVVMPADSSVHAVDEVLAEVERRLARIRTDDVEAIATTRGLSRNELRPVREDWVGMATVTFVPIDERSSNHAGRDQLERASGLFDDLVGPEQIQVIEQAIGPPVGAPIVVRIAGDDPARLASIAHAVESALHEVPGVRDIENTSSGDKREVLVRVDEGRAALHGLTAGAVGRWLRLAFSDAPLATTLVDNERVHIVLHLASEAHTPDQMRALTLRAPDGSEVPLGDIATVEEGRRPAHIQRNDRRRGVAVMAQIDHTTNAQEANRRAAARLDPIREANPDVEITLRGEFEETNESLHSLILAFAFAVFVIYGILAAQFRSFLTPFVVVSAIPLSLIGVIIGFFVTGSAVGLIALVGVVGLAGIAVNDSLVLVDCVDRLRADGVVMDDAIKRACRQRLRPIVATSLTTIAGILPLAFAGADAPLLSPMATAIVWGLTAAMLLTLIVVPCMYRVSSNVSEVAEQRLGPLWRRITGAEPVTAPTERS